MTNTQNMKLETQRNLAEMLSDELHEQRLRIASLELDRHAMQIRLHALERRVSELDAR